MVDIRVHILTILISINEPYNHFTLQLKLILHEHIPACISYTSIYNTQNNIFFFFQFWIYCHYCILWDWEKLRISDGKKDKT